MKAPAGLTLYEHKESVCCHKVAITFAEKQLEPEIVNVSLERQGQRQPWYLAINPLGMVPALVHDGRPIIHSTIITEYLDDAFPDPPLMPKDPYWRARRRLWARRIEEGMHVPHIAAISFIVAFGHQFRARMNSPEKLQAYFDNIKDVRYRETIRSWYDSDLNSELLYQSLRAYHDFLHDMEATLREVPWLAGETYSLADIDVIPYLWRLSNLQLDFLWAKLPHVSNWFTRVTQRPAFKTAIIDVALPEWVDGMREAGSRAKPRLVEAVAAFDTVAA
ncbi:glutathione S-transferase family protein [Lichenicoccus sp.]|uniref:glutathione S-transferase family protein n=1 Tax=Lichenicoccus sp. TaxID=2781899 RepID=UPI003D0E6C50